MKQFATCLLTLLLLAPVLAGCTQPSSQANTSAASPTDAPVTLTLLSNWSAPDIEIFADAIHKQLPHITLDWESCPIGAIPYADEVTRRVMHNAEADIFMTTDTGLWNSGKLLNLTDESFVSKYNLSIMKTLSGDGSVYFVPGLGDVLCYLYNSKWLEESGLPVPQTEAELDLLFAAMLEAGKQPFMLPYAQMPTQYVKVLLAGYLSTPKGQQWMSDYNQGKTSMAQNEQWQRLWKQVQELTQKGYLRPEDMVYTENMRITVVQDQAAFMTTFSSGQYSKLIDKNRDQFDLMPLLGEKPQNQMVYTAPTGYFAVSNRLSAPQNKAKRAAAIQVLDFLSTLAGQEVLRGDCPIAISYLSEAILPLQEQYSNLSEIIKRGAYTQMPHFERGVEAVIEEVFALLVEGKILPEDAIRACDEQNANYTAAPTAKPLPILGRATELFPWSYMQSRTEEMAVANFCMDSVRKAAGTEYALELGTAFRGEFFEGEITAADVESVIRQEKKLYLVEVSGQEIWDLIKQGVMPVKGSAWFIAPSGFRYRYQRLADGTGKLLEVTLEDGTPLNLQKSYKVAVSENQVLPVPNTVNFSESKKIELPFTLREAVTQRILQEGEISPKLDGRIEIIEPQE